MNLLIAVGTSVAYFYSVAVLFMPQLFPENMRNLYFESSCAIITFVLLGRYLESRAKRKASDFMKKLISLKPDKARVVVDGKEVEIPAENVVKGDLLVVKSGEKIPADGTIEHGEGEVDESMITGESVPVLKKIGDKVIGGTILVNGYIRFRAEKTGKETVLYQIIKLLLEAQSKKPPIGRLADKITAYFVPVILIIAIIVFNIWFLFGNDLQLAILSAVSVLIIACPCALGLATPIAIVSSVGKGAKEGLLIKNPECIEEVQNIDTAVFDKTGTLTYGQLSVVETDIDDIDLLKLIASAEKKANHPVAKAIFEYVTSKGVLPDEPEEFKNFVGKGVYAKVKGKKVYIGNIKLLEDLGFKIDKKEKKDLTTIFVVIENKMVGSFYLEDRIKKESKRVIEFFKNKGITTVLLTGDNYAVAQKVAIELGIDDFLAEVSPENKYSYIEKLQKEGKKVLFVGDGINDAPAMSRANVGIAVGGGTQIAKEAGDIILLKDTLDGVIKAFRLSQESIKIIKQNLFWAYIYNVIFIPVAGGALYPFFGFMLKPVFAGIAMSMSSVTVVLNALRLYRVKF